MKNNKGFTLIELLAVIVILAIIALIATPLTINIINDAKKKSFANTAYGLIDTVKLKYAENYLMGNTDELFYTFPEATGLNFGGERPKGGTIRLMSDGKISLAIYNDNWCAVKGLDASKVTVTKYEEGKCILQEEADVPVITLKGKDIMYIGIGKTFTDPGFSVKTVGGEELDNNLVDVKIIGQTTNKEEIDTSIEETYSITYSIEYKDKTDVKTRTVHVGNYDPTIVIEPNGTNEYEKTLDITISVNAYEKFSINGFTYTIIKDNVEGSPINVNELTKVLTLNEDGIYKIKVSAKDSEGNTSEYTSEEFKIDSSITEPNIEAKTSPNANGWYKEDIEISITTSTDVSEIKEIKYCKAINTTCDPNIILTGNSGQVTVDIESDGNYICAISIDTAGNESKSTCSGPYALDKTKPILTIPTDAIIKSNTVASYNLLDGTSAIDRLSNIDGSITTNGDLSALEGEYNITYTVKDKAGNKVEDSRKITVLGATNWTYTSNGNFTVPVTGIYTIEMHGGGGGSGGSASARHYTNSSYASASGGSGGGSGETYTTILTAGTSYAITIGTAGTRGESDTAVGQVGTKTYYASGEKGGTGGSTSFGSLYTIAGGNGGSGGHASASLNSASKSNGEDGTSVGSLASGSSGGASTGNYGDAGKDGALFISFVGGLSFDVKTDNIVYINAGESVKLGNVTIKPSGGNTFSDILEKGNEITLELSEGFRFIESALTYKATNGSNIYPNVVWENNEITITVGSDILLADDITISGIMIEATTAEAEDIATITISSNNINSVKLNVAVALAPTEPDITYWAFTSNGTFTVPVTGIYEIEMHGGGGGNGGTATARHYTNSISSIGYGGSGGGSGETYTTILTAGTSYSITIGAAGTKGDSDSSSGQVGGDFYSAHGKAGSDGGSTSFGSLYTISGGSGGKGGEASASLTSSTNANGKDGKSVGSLASGNSGGSSTGNYGDAGNPGAIFITWKKST